MNNDSESINDDTELDLGQVSDISGANSSAAGAEDFSAPADQVSDGEDQDNVLDDTLSETLDSPDPSEIIASLGDDLARAKADLYNLQQEYSKYVRRSKAEAGIFRQAGQSEVVESLLSVLDDIDAARSHGDLEEGPFVAITEKIESTLQTRFELERYGNVGDEFDPNIHEALMAQESDQVQVATIARVLQPGYRLGERILRPTKVLVDNPV